MKRRLIFFTLGFCSLSGGCSMAANAVHNLSFETTQGVADCRERARNRQLAREAWTLYVEKNGNKEHSEDYAEGFKDGFSDYVEAGGTGQPPPVPPHRYWKLRYQNPTGYVAIEDWFAGFRMGAAVAREGEWFSIVPSSLSVAQSANSPGLAQSPPREPFFWETNKGVASKAAEAR
jgi:hypothetical protein